MKWLRGRNLTVSPGYEPSVATFYYPALGIILLLAGCATAPTATIPVPVSCVKSAPEKPATQDEAAILAMTEYAATMVTWTERLLLKAYSEKAEAIISACK